MAKRLAVTELVVVSVLLTWTMPLEAAQAPCDCSRDAYNCSSFRDQRSAQTCYCYCLSVAGSDIHKLDGDRDAYACEANTCPCTTSCRRATRQGPTATPQARSRAGCDPSYPSVCIASPPPDLDCADIAYRRFEVVGADPHRFDSDNDGVGCESG